MQPGLIGICYRWQLPQKQKTLNNPKYNLHGFIKELVSSWVMEVSQSLCHWQPNIPAVSVHSCSVDQDQVSWVHPGDIIFITCTLKSPRMKKKSLWDFKGFWYPLVKKVICICTLAMVELLPVSLCKYLLLVWTWILNDRSIICQH